MKVYQWEAKGKSNEDGRTVGFRGEFDADFGVGQEDHDNPMAYIKTSAEHRAMEEAYRRDIDPDTVELVEVSLVAKG